jgi:hypothetical protein
MAFCTSGDQEDFRTLHSSSPANPPSKTVGTNGLRDYWLVRVDTNGNSLWQTNFGGTLDDYLDAMVATSDGGCILAGYSYSGINGNKSATNWGPK